MPLDVHWKARLIFLVLLGAAGLGGWYFLSSSAYALYEIETHDPVSGLTVGSPVEMHGVEIGTVHRIRLADPRTVEIVLSIDHDAPMITRATTAIVTARGMAARGFMGYVYIALENSGTIQGPLTRDADHSYPVIATAASQIDTIDTTAAAAVQDVRTITQLLESLLDPSMLTSLKGSVRDLSEVLGLLVTNEGHLQSSITNIDRDTQQIGLLLDEKTVASLKQSAEQVQDIMTSLTANSQTITSLIANAEQDSRDLKPLLNASNAALRELRTELLPQLYQAVGDLDRLAHVLRPVATRAVRDPSSLIRGIDVPPGPGER